MKSNNNLEVILFPKHALTDLRQKELVNWLATTVQAAIAKQHERTKRMFLRVLKDSPPICMS